MIIWKNPDKKNRVFECWFSRQADWPFPHLKDWQNTICLPPFLLYTPLQHLVLYQTKLSPLSTPYLGALCQTKLNLVYINIKCLCSNRNVFFFSSLWDIYSIPPPWHTHLVSHINPNFPTYFVILSLQLRLISKFRWPHPKFGSLYINTPTHKINWQTTYPLRLFPKYGLFSWHLKVKQTFDSYF